MSAISEGANEASGRWAALRVRYHWIDHVVVAYQQFTKKNGNFYAAGITYFSFLAIFPIIFLAVSVAGFVIGDSGHLHDELFDNITKNVPGGFGDTVKTAINSAVERRTSVGIIGLVGVLLSGLGWIGNLRQAIDAVCGVEPRKRNIVLAKLADLLALGGLGLGILLSLGVTVLGTAFSKQLATLLRVQNLHGAFLLFAVLGIALAVLGDMLIVGWVIVHFPNVKFPTRVLIRGALLAAVGLEILKLIGTAYIAKIAASPTYGVLGSIIGVLIWIDLVSRYLLFATTWTATSHGVILEPDSVHIVTHQVPLEIPRRSASYDLERELRKQWRKA